VIPGPGRFPSAVKRATAELNPAGGKTPKLWVVDDAGKGNKGRRVESDRGDRGEDNDYGA